jgi:hypothetical protein
MTQRYQIISPNAKGSLSSQELASGLAKAGQLLLHEARRRKMAEARHRRRERNLKLRQPTLVEERQFRLSRRPRGPR